MAWHEDGVYSRVASTTFIFRTNLLQTLSISLPISVQGDAILIPGPFPIGGKH